MAATILPLAADDKYPQRYKPDSRVLRILGFIEWKEFSVRLVSGWIARSTMTLFLNTSPLDFWTVHSSPSTAWAVTPLLLYPFLPSRRLFFSIPCEVFLIWPSALGLLHHAGWTLLSYIDERLPSNPWQFWQLPLMWVTLLAGCDMMISSRRRGYYESDKEEEEDEFEMSSTEATLWLLHVPVVTWVIVPAFANLADDEADWLWFGVRLLLLVVYVLAYLGTAHRVSMRIIRPSVRCFASRPVCCWEGASGERCEGECRPVEAEVLAGGWLLAMPFVLTVIMAIW